QNTKETIMWFRSLFDSLKSPGSHLPVRRQDTKAVRRTAYRPRLEALEDRRLLSFSLGGDFDPGGNVSDIVIADLNRDGRPDVVTVGKDASVLLGDGTGGLAPAQHFPLDS